MYELWLTQCMACMEASRAWYTMAQLPWGWAMAVRGGAAAPASEPWLQCGRRTAPVIGNCAAAVYSRFGLNLERLRVASPDEVSTRRVGA